MIIRPIVLGFALIWAMLYVFVPDSFNLLVPFKELRVPLFTGFLTVGAFLLTLKTFILIKLKEDLYNSDAYKKRLKEQRDVQSNLSHYGPLRRLGEFLIYSVAGAMITAVSQLTIGFVETRAAITFCIAAALTTGILVTIAWWQIRANLMDWFDLLEK